MNLIDFGIRRLENSQKIVVYIIDFTDKDTDKSYLVNATNEGVEREGSVNDPDESDRPYTAIVGERDLTDDELSEVCENLKDHWHETTY